MRTSVTESSQVSSNIVGVENRSSFLGTEHVKNTIKITIAIIIVPSMSTRYIIHHADEHHADYYPFSGLLKQ